MTILLRRFFPCPPVERWRNFEAVMKECLLELNHRIVELDLDPAFPPDPPETEFGIYSHKTRREVPHAGLFYKEMHMKGLFTIDRDGWGADHSQSRTPPDLSRSQPAEARKFCSAIRSRFVSTGISKQLQPPIRDVGTRFQPYILAPLQLPTDDTIMFHSPLSVVEFVHTLADWAEARRQNLVFKLHPGTFIPSIAEAVEERTSRSSYVFVLNENIHALIAQALGVVVINSGTGFESLIHGAPVATFGGCDYQWATFRACAATLDDARAYMESYREEDRERGFQFIHHYYHQHAYPTGDDAGDEAAEGVKARLFEYLKEVIPS